MKIIVIGAGIVGLTTAWALADAGHAVTVIDRQPGPARGCSAANGGFLSPAHCAPWAAPGVLSMALRSSFDRTAPFRWRPDFSLDQLRWLLAMARQCTAEAYARNRQRMFALARYSSACHAAADRQLAFAYERRAGVIQPCRSPAGQAALQALAGSLQAQGADAAWLDRDATLALEPALGASSPDLVGALQLKDEGSGRCERYAHQLAERLARQDVTLHWNTVATGLETTGGTPGRPRLRALLTADATLPADAVVVAAGPQAAGLLAARLRLPVYPVKGYSMTARIVDPTRAPRHAILDDRSKLAIAPFDEVVRVAGIAEVVGHDTHLDPRRCRQLAAAFDALYPGAVETATAEFWAGLRPMTPDGTPIIGATDIEGLFVNTGHGTYGWTLAWGSARLLADILDDRPAALPAKDYALARFGSGQTPA